MERVRNRAPSQTLQGRLAPHHGSVYLQHNRRSPIRIRRAKDGEGSANLLRFALFTGVSAFRAVIFPNMCFGAA